MTVICYARKIKETPSLKRTIIKFCWSCKKKSNFVGLRFLHIVRFYFFYIKNWLLL